MRSSLAVMPTTQLVVNDLAPASTASVSDLSLKEKRRRTICEKADGLEEVLDQDGLEHVQLQSAKAVSSRPP